MADNMQHQSDTVIDDQQHIRKWYITRRLSFNSIIRDNCV